MSIKPKVDIDVLLYMFQEYETKTIHDFILFFNHERITLKMADSV
ncbi:Mobile element protein [Staphylococcus aureus]|nr:hypothetical protein [Staphylococcus aureus]QBX60691.1 Mobile element protein [Staphylococcus aureus]QBX61005.1 Mobile element protein [Staphylococcus aureus]QBX61418.1 Mobile element protein [Staphylococcus aureus]QBX61960.1 Mobile element protein [Staphylococcus aureus]QBX62270.1 Mobile element protein [Staphylococcus aureus]